MTTKINSPFAKLTDAAYWLEQRDSMMAMARSNMAALMNKDGFWKYDRDDRRVLSANRQWVERARRCNRIALGRIPVFHQTFISNGRESSGLIYATERPSS